MSRRTDTRLNGLVRRANALAARIDPQPLTMVVQLLPADVEHPHGTRVQTDRWSWTVYADPSLEEPELPPAAPDTVVIIHEFDPHEHEPVPWPWEMDDVEDIPVR